ncbi:alkaline phosphatase family protein [Saccharopolyspora rosea]|uniref:Alkaline phosphatase family protein n=1 Tax=Saccharopolyspora rosea TaxID=524884 RepID=A0ABW3G2T4_9PSEU|nr:alkaline phosphatase family protein [Saccharopolyspora rosea]
MTTGRSLFAAGLALLTALVVAVTSSGDDARAAAPPPVGHVFVINLENKGFDETWGPDSKAPYLSRTLRAQGNLLTQYYGTAHNSLGNYLAQISGQGPNAETQADCQTYSPFRQTGTAAPGQAVGQGCVYPSSVPTLAGQLTGSGRTWKGYMEDMGTPCRHPRLGAVDDTQQARVGDQYAARHNPFVYFASITGSPECAADDVDLSALPRDLQQVRTTPTLSYITPDLCDDAHDAPCVDGRPGGLASADEWLRTWVPKILASPAYQQDGMLIVTFDESDGPQQDSGACCGEGPGPNAPLPGITGPGGGRTGALVLSKHVRPGSTSDTPYNHYSLLASIEDLFALPRLGYAGSPGLTPFGADVYNA